MFVCDHSYASVSQHGVNQKRGWEGGSRVKRALALILSHVVVCFLLLNTESQRARQREKISLE